MYIEDKILKAGFWEVGNRPDMVFFCDNCGICEYSGIAEDFTQIYEHPDKGCFCYHCILDKFMNLDKLAEINELTGKANKIKKTLDMLYDMLRMSSSSNKQGFYVTGAKTVHLVELDHAAFEELARQYIPKLEAEFDAL